MDTADQMVGDGIRSGGFLFRKRDCRIDAMTRTTQSLLSAKRIATAAEQEARKNNFKFR
jgi:hypothetical protein